MKFAMSTLSVSKTSRITSASFACTFIELPAVANIIELLKNNTCSWKIFNPANRPTNSLNLAKSLIVYLAAAVESCVIGKGNNATALLRFDLINFNDSAIDVVLDRLKKPRFFSLKDNYKTNLYLKL